MGRRRLTVEGEKKISLEEYVDFSITANYSGFTISYLNQIIRMHGFRKLHKSSKKIVGEAVDSLDLIDLSRSTLNQTGVSPSSSSASPSSSSLTLDEVITDIEALKWQECCLTSLETITSDKSTEAAVPKLSKRKYNKRKRVTMKKLLTISE